LIANAVPGKTTEGTIATETLAYDFSNMMKTGKTSLLLVRCLAHKELKGAKILLEENKEIDDLDEVFFLIIFLNTFLMTKDTLEAPLNLSMNVKIFLFLLEDSFLLFTLLLREAQEYYSIL
ncbi:hypothetical protein ACJX0J_012633, partial [Zea mays]